MDRSWMFLKHRFCEAFTDGVNSFILAAKKHLNEDYKTRCPCRDCLNGNLHSLHVIRSHLYNSGFAPHYKVWTLHGEFQESGSSAQIEDDSENDSDSEDNEMFEMLHDFQGPTYMGTNVDATSGNDNSHASKYEYLFGKAQRELYPGCENFSVLSFIVELMHIKCLSLMSNKHFDMLLNLLKRSHPKEASIPSTNNDAKKMLRELGLGYESIHACKNDCALFWKTNEKLDKCPECGEPRYKPCFGKRKKIPQKVLRYLPIKPRLQRLYMSRYTAKDMNWHKERRVNEEGVLRHPADSDEWKEFDKKYPLFAQDSRNVRLGLATDGFNPFANMSKPYSMWPVILVCYNLPPWKCMKAVFSMLTLLIPGPNAPGKEIDVYLRPLVDELKELWVDGIQTFDASTGEIFSMHACVLWTINDFPAYGNLSSWSTKGYLACPICNKDITSQRITNKISYMGHRRFLPCGHAWREMSTEYNGHTEHRLPPKVLSGVEILQQLDKVRSFSPGKYENNRERDRPRAAEELN